MPDVKTTAPERLYTLREVSALVDMSERHLRRQIHAGKLVGWIENRFVQDPRTGRFFNRSRYRFTGAALRAWFELRAAQPTPVNQYGPRVRERSARIP